MPFLAEENRIEIRRAFDTLKDAVLLEIFTRREDCLYGAETRELMNELGRLHEKVRVSFVDLDREPDAAPDVDKVPCIFLRSSESLDRVPIRFYGIPSGSAFQAFLEAVLDLSFGETPLKASSKAALSRVSRPLHLQVFISPTCEFCPYAIRWATLAAIEQPSIRADIVKSTDFLGLAERYQITSVPTVVVDEETTFPGAVPEKEFIKHLISAAD